MIRSVVLLLLFVTPRSDAETVFKALDEGDIATLSKFTPAKLIEIIRAGRPVAKLEAGELEPWKIDDAFGGSTTLYVDVPDGYDPAKPAGVILLLHGLGGNGKQLKDLLLEKFASQNNCVIAAPSAGKEPEGNEDYADEDAKLKQWWSYRPGGFPMVALARLKRTIAIDDNRVILGGYSMGGFGTWNIGLRYSDRFAALIPCAGGISRNEWGRKKPDDRLRGLLENAFSLPIYAVHGDNDKTVPVEFDRLSRDRLKELGYAFEYEEVPKGGHIINVREGGEIMSRIQDWLKPKARDAHPKRVVHCAIGAYAASSYWVCIDELDGDTARIEATIKDGNVIELVAKGAKRATVFIDEKWIDVEKPVKIVAGGKELFSGAAAPSVETVLESWKLREDRELTYRAKVVVELPR